MSESAYTDGSLEPQVNEKGILSDTDALFSIAISLKRIADMLREVLDEEDEEE